MLLKIPERMTRKEFRDILSREHRHMMEDNFATHAEPDYYRTRSVLLYGIAEITRSKMCFDLLETNRVGTFGGMMSISHDGDRVSRPAADGNYEPVEMDCGDAYLHRLIVDLGSEDPDRVLGAQLYMQAGSYACSTPEIDQMVDIASSVPGVAGAQIAGAGLGGCIMVLAKKDSVQDVRKALVQRYYRPAGLKPAVLPCIAVEGAGLVTF
jgi:N-acetylgalactosamine kinase